MITSEGTCRLVMPLSELTMYIGGRSVRHSSMALRISGRSLTRSSRSARPELGFTPSAVISSPYCSKTGASQAVTAWPKMIGSETFIIVAFRCSENSTPSRLVRSICSARKASSAFALMKVASTTSPSIRVQPSLSTVAAPSLPTNSIFAAPAWAALRVADFSLE